MTEDFKCFSWSVCPSVTFRKIAGAAQGPEVAAVGVAALLGKSIKALGWMRCDVGF